MSPPLDLSRLELAAQELLAFACICDSSLEFLYWKPPPRQIGTARFSRSKRHPRKSAVPQPLLHHGLTCPRFDCVHLESMSIFVSALLALGALLALETAASNYFSRKLRSRSSRKDLKINYLIEERLETSFSGFSRMEAERNLRLTLRRESRTTSASRSAHFLALRSMCNASYRRIRA